MTYWHWLLGLSLAFIVIERLRPRYEDQKVLRPGLLSDVLYIVLNGHFLGVLLAKATTPLVAALDAQLSAQGLHGAFYLGAAGSLPWWAQFVIALFAVDLTQYLIHRLLHAVPPLWKLHKVHHSIEVMDFWGSMRFHFGEVVVYKALSYPVLALFGFDGGVLFALAVVGTAIGHFNHSNLTLPIGPLRYLLNHPEMHIWHHVHPDAGPMNKNFGVNLSLWDWLFKTAYIPNEPPARLGFEDIETYPKTIAGQLLLPLPLERLFGRDGRD